MRRYFALSSAKRPELTRPGTFCRIIPQIPILDLARQRARQSPSFLRETPSESDRPGTRPECLVPVSSPRTRPELVGDTVADSSDPFSVIILCADAPRYLPEELPALEIEKLISPARSLARSFIAAANPRRGGPIPHLLLLLLPCRSWPF